MNFTLVAPRTDLLFADAEIQSIIATGIVPPDQILIGDVRHVDVVRVLTASKCAGVWFCTHSTTDGIMLSDGLLPASLIVSLIRGRFRCVILNTCNSAQIAVMINDETDAEVIATITDVPDREAFQTGALLADQIARTNDLELAHNRSKPGGNRTYIRLAGSKKK